MDEQWKDIYNGNYSISNLGRVRANERIIETKTGLRHYKEKILKQEKTSDGHLRVVLSDCGKRTRVFVHRLVAENFIPNPNNYPVINHKDENAENNRVDNLEWCTVSYNNTYNNRHKKIGDAEGTSINVVDSNGMCVDCFESITKASLKYSIPLTTLWRYIQTKKPIKGLKFIKSE